MLHELGLASVGSLKAYCLATLGRAANRTFKWQDIADLLKAMALKNLSIQQVHNNLV